MLNVYVCIYRIHTIIASTTPQLTYLTKCSWVAERTHAVVVLTACASILTLSFTCNTHTRVNASRVPVEATPPCCSSTWPPTHSSWHHRTSQRSHLHNHSHRCCTEHLHNGSTLHRCSTFGDRWLRRGLKTLINQTLTPSVMHNHRLVT